MKLNIRKKLLFSILITTSLIYFATFAYLFTVMIKDTKRYSVDIIKQAAEKYSLVVKNKLELNYLVANAFANSLLKYPEIDPKLRDDIYMPMLKEAVLNNSEYMALWYSWELNAVQKGYQKKYGRVRYAFYRQKDISSFAVDTLNIDGDNTTSIYYQIKINPHPITINPYYDSYTGRPDDSIRMTTVAIPLYHQAKFAGILGIDINLNFFNNLAESMKLSENSKSFIAAPDGNFIAFTDNNLPGTTYSEYFTWEDTTKIGNKNKIKQAKFFYTTKNGIEYYTALFPIHINNSELPWLVGLMQPVSEIFQTIRKTTYIFIAVSLLGMIFTIYVITILSLRITNPLKNITETIDLVAKGNISLENSPHIKSGDEVEDISNSVATLINNLNSTANFAIEIGKGNLSYNFKPLSKYDVLGNSLLKMRKSLQQAENERKIRQAEDEKLNWTNVGTAKFADIVRKNSDDIEKLAYAVISQLVKYVNANQGGLFIINEEIDEKENKKQYFIDLIAAYAFERKKYIQKRSSIDVGLLGRTVKEAETIYMTSIPNDYIHITSGLGEENPKVLLLVPMLFNDEVFGVIELASFYEIEKYKIKFVEAISESIASSIFRTGINISNAKLLEETQKKSKEMAIHEAEIHESMENMQVENKQLANKIKELKNILTAVKQISYFAEYDLDGRITYVNDRFLNILKVNKDNIIGKYQGSFNTKHRSMDEFNAFWDQLRAGVVMLYQQDWETEAGFLHLSEVYTPVQDTQGEVYKIISISTIESIKE